MPKPKRYEMWVEGNSPGFPQMQNLLSATILEYVLIEDVTGPLCAVVIREQYVSRLAEKMRRPLHQTLLDAGHSMSPEQLHEICQRSASEVFVVRGLHEACHAGEVALDDIKRLPFYQTYREYFDQSPNIVAKAFGIAVLAAAAAQVVDEGNN